MSKSKKDIIDVLAFLNEQKEELNQQIDAFGDIMKMNKESIEATAYLDNRIFFIDQLIKVVTPLQHYYDSTQGLWAFDKDPGEVDLEWIRANAFRLK